MLKGHHSTNAVTPLPTTIIASLLSSQPPLKEAFLIKFGHESSRCEAFMVETDHQKSKSELWSRLALYTFQFFSLILFLSHMRSAVVVEDSRVTIIAVVGGCWEWHWCSYRWLSDFGLCRIKCGSLICAYQFLLMVVVLVEQIRWWLQDGGGVGCWWCCGWSLWVRVFKQGGVEEYEGLQIQGAKRESELRDFGPTD